MPAMKWFIAGMFFLTQSVVFSILLHGAAEIRGAHTGQAVECA